MRMFIALPVPEEIQNVLKEHSDTMMKLQSLAIRQTNEPHLTLRFLGDVDEKTREKLIEALLKKSFAVPSVSVRGMGAFPSVYRARVFWAGIEANQALDALQKNVEKACEEAGFEPELRPFRPHITLLRATGIISNELIHYVHTHKKSELGDFQASELNLYKSLLTPEGAIYEKIHSFPVRMLS